MAHREEHQASKSSSGTAMGNRNRTSGIRLSPPGDAAFRSIRSLFIALTACLAAVPAFAQVAITPETTPAVGPGGPFHP